MKAYNKDFVSNAQTLRRNMTHEEKDKTRDRFLEGQRLRVLRFPNESIRKNFTDVCQVILNHIDVKFEDLKES